MTTTTTNRMTARETALYRLCMSAAHERAAAMEECRRALGRALVTTPAERARVASAIADAGYDGIGRVVLAIGEINAAARADASLSAAARGF